MDKTLHVLTDELISKRPILETVAAALEGGADVIQLRAKTLPRREVFELAVLIRKITTRERALFFINDYLDIALMVEADGVHLGQQDLPYQEARDLADAAIQQQITGGRRLFIGISAGNLEEAIEAERMGAGYIGFGPVFPTLTKSDASAPQGVEELRKVMAAVKTPVVAIGGIGLDNLDQVLSTGCSNVAVISAVAAADDPCAAAKALKQKIINIRP